MSVWTAEELIRRSLRLCRPVYQQHGFLVASSASSSPGQKLTRIQRQSQSQRQPPWCPVGSVRFYSQERDISDEAEEKDLSLPHEMQVENAAAEQRQWSSPFLKHLERCGSPSDVLDLTRLYAPTIRQVSSSLVRMWAVTKKMSEDQRRYELQLMFEHPALDELLQKAMRTISLMRHEDMVYTLLSMVNLGVPQRSRVVQTSLRTLQEKLNDLDEKCLSILASCLEHMDDCPNVVALKAGLSLVVEERLSGIKNVVTLQTMMRLLGKDAPKELKWKLEKKALSMADQFSVPNAQWMISTMVTMGFYSKPLLEVCSRKITENLHGIPFNRLLKLLHSCKELLYRDFYLLTAISDYIASTVDIWTNKQLLLLLSVFESLAFCPAAVMEAYAEKVIADPDMLTLKDLLCVLKVYSSLNYDLQHQRRPFLDSLGRALDSYLPKMTAFALLKAVYCLCLLGHFPPAALERLQQSGTPPQQLADSKSLKNRERMFHTVELCLRLDRPPLPPSVTFPTSVTEGPAPSQSSMNPWLLEGLRSLLEDQEHVTLQEMVTEEDFYLIDAVITKRESSRRPESDAGERGPPAERSRRIAVVHAAPSKFCFGTLNPRGPLALKARHLRILGYEPVLVSELELQSVSEEQRTEFLRTRIFPELVSESRAEAGLAAS
ncbi:FAST kinase domain-containing protein 2, mitochondrial-like isoform X1 [Salarias fasciatus]|uniref:FAST kinase domain-containing protein 2, mitochondrial-like isoform X1 n=2 Tax=Salarias fasciatus TaxID=181472 RepID=UPI001176617C|nr:FAST kinase domain-containing protein 2, mitochondrial-like isoform X1 [Salarias fasciatus]XP_029941802.1 FAST kinase domain-containing protein 2, mitochondrial-like isoform X1 [Salarias fasciatus]